MTPAQLLALRPASPQPCGLRQSPLPIGRVDGAGRACCICVIGDRNAATTVGVAEGTASSPPCAGTFGTVLVALTIDVEAPDQESFTAGNFGPLMAMLAEQAAPATLFVNGEWALAAPANEIAAIRDSGMLVGLHSFRHVGFMSLTGEEIDNQLTFAEAALKTRGIHPTRPLFRLPGLDGEHSQFVLQSVASHGWWHVHYQSGGDDWKPENQHRAADVAAKATGDIDKLRAAGRSSAIVLAHSWPDPTTDALLAVINYARANGDELVSVAALPRAAWAEQPPT